MRIVALRPREFDSQLECGLLLKRDRQKLLADEKAPLSHYSSRAAKTVAAYHD